MTNFSDPASVADLFPTTCWVFKTTGIGDGIVVRFPEGFYIKIYYSENQNGAYDITGGWNGEVSPCLNTTVDEKDMKRWCSQISSAKSFIKVIHEAKMS